MRLNTLKPAVGSKQKLVRVGRGIGSGLGKTCGRGHKGAKARSGYSRKIGFEGGQLPLQRRLPKFGFNSLVNKKTSEVRLSDLNKVDAEIIDLSVLKNMGLVGRDVIKVKVILTGTINRVITLVGVGVTAGARKAIEHAGGKIQQK